MSLGHSRKTHLDTRNVNTSLTGHQADPSNTPEGNQYNSRPTSHDYGIDEPPTLVGHSHDVDRNNRRRVSVACNRCRKRKIRCSGPSNNGACSNCNEPKDAAQCTFNRVASTAIGWQAVSNDAIATDYVPTISELSPTHCSARCHEQTKMENEAMTSRQPKESIPFGYQNTVFENYLPSFRPSGREQRTSVSVSASIPLGHPYTQMNTAPGMGTDNHFLTMTSSAPGSALGSSIEASLPNTALSERQLPSPILTRTSRMSSSGVLAAPNPAGYTTSASGENHRQIQYAPYNGPHRPDCPVVKATYSGQPNSNLAQGSIPSNAPNQWDYLPHPSATTASNSHMADHAHYGPGDPMWSNYQVSYGPTYGFANHQAVSNAGSRSHSISSGPHSSYQSTTSRSRSPMPNYTAPTSGYGPF